MSIVIFALFLSTSLIPVTPPPHLSSPAPSQFMELMEAKYGEQAREAGVYIVSACGFDCIPNDLGGLFLQRNFSGELASIESYIAASAVSKWVGGGVA